MTNVESIDVKGVSVPIGDLRGIDLKGMMIDVASGSDYDVVIIDNLEDFYGSDGWKDSLEIKKDMFKKEHSQFYLACITKSLSPTMIISCGPNASGTLTFHGAQFNSTNGIFESDDKSSYVFKDEAGKHSFYSSNYSVVIIGV